MKKLRNSCIEALTQFSQVLELINEQTPERALVIYADSGLGKHCRHTLDHFLVLQEGLKKGLIDYNKRNRESLLERDHQVAAQQISKILLWLNSTSQLNEDRAIDIQSEISCTKFENIIIHSSLKRELHYLSQHSIHHVAYCALLLKQHNIKVDPSIGLAASTASYLRAVS